MEESQKLLERFCRFNSSVLGDAKDKQSSLERDVEVFKALSSFTVSWVRDLRQVVDSPFSGSLGIQSPVEQKLRHAQVRKTHSL